MTYEPPLSARDLAPYEARLRLYAVVVLALGIGLGGLIWRLPAAFHGKLLNFAGTYFSTVYAVYTLWFDVRRVSNPDNRRIETFSVTQLARTFEMLFAIVGILGLVLLSAGLFIAF